MRLGRLVGVLLGLLLALPATASAGHWWMWGPNIFHMHAPRNPSFSYYNWADENADMNLRCEYARGFWSANPNIDIYNISGPPAAAQITCEDGFWGQTGWLGLASYEGPTDFNTGHYQKMHALNNLSYLGTNGTGYNRWEWRQAVACQEVGHGFGMLHLGPGCMGVSYQVPDPYSSAARVPSAHDNEHVSWLYGGLH